VNEKMRSQALHAAVLLADAVMLEAMHELDLDTIPCLGGCGKRIPLRSGPAFCCDCLRKRSNAAPASVPVVSPPRQAPASGPVTAFLNSQMTTPGGVPAGR
jgi:hypothetical protein